MRKVWQKAVGQLVRLMSDTRVPKAEYAEACEEVSSLFDDMASAAREELRREEGDE
jgi:hypothetical protein